MREILPTWLAGKDLQMVAEQAGVDRKTVRRYVDVAVAVGIDRDRGADRLTDELIGEVLAAVRPAGHGAAWERLEARREQISEWVGRDLTVVKIGGFQTRQGRYGSGPVDTACGWALAIGVISATEIASILEAATKNTPVQAPRTAQARTLARFACDASGFRRVKSYWMKVIDGGALDGEEGVGT